MWPLGCWFVRRATGLSLSEQARSGAASLVAALARAALTTLLANSMLDAAPLARLATCVSVGVLAYAALLEWGVPPPRSADPPPRRWGATRKWARATGAERLPAPGPDDRRTSRKARPRRRLPQARHLSSATGSSRAPACTNGTGPQSTGRTGSRARKATRRTSSSCRADPARFRRREHPIGRSRFRDRRWPARDLRDQHQPDDARLAAPQEPASRRGAAPDAHALLLGARFASRDSSGTQVRITTRTRIARSMLINALLPVTCGYPDRALAGHAPLVLKTCR